MKLITKNGFIRIGNDVISAIASYSAMNCFGVKAISRRKPRVRSGASSAVRPRGAKVTVENRKVCIDLRIAMEHGVNMRAVGMSIMEEVRYMVESTTGIKVGRVNIFVDSVVVST